MKYIVEGTIILWILATAWCVITLWMEYMGVM